MSSMKGLGTSDNLLINWMCISKVCFLIGFAWLLLVLSAFRRRQERMDEVREHFVELDNRGLPKWIDGDCGNADYKACEALKGLLSR